MNSGESPTVNVRGRSGRSTLCLGGRLLLLAGNIRHFLHFVRHGNSSSRSHFPLTSLMLTVCTAHRILLKAGLQLSKIVRKYETLQKKFMLNFVHRAGFLVCAVHRYHNGMFHWRTSCYSSITPFCCVNLAMQSDAEMWGVLSTSLLTGWSYFVVWGRCQSMQMHCSICLYP
jgi:hypothetical protein